MQQRVQGAMGSLVVTLLQICFCGTESVSEVIEHRSAFSEDATRARVQF